MDELIIEDKKYVSSKRAAKMTGYAKDYIGQLCREGRVPARLVGRSWYVLETAIQDHRFGTADIQSEESQQSSVPEAVISDKWESPRYETASDELLPSVNRLKTAEMGFIDENSEEVKESERLQDTWKTWFDRIADTETDVPVVENVKTDAKAEIEVIETKTEVVEKIEEEPVDVPMHTIYRQPPEELLPHSTHLEVEPPSEDEEQEELVVTQKERKGWNRVSIMAVQVFSVLLAVIVSSLAVIGSGYLDEYIISSSQVRIIAGVGVYNK